MGWLDRFKPRRDVRETMIPLYNAVITTARQPHWYTDGAVPDTLDGRFDMVALILSLLLIRLEDDPAMAQPSVWLTELFVDDMDGQLRQIGFGDMVVGKQVGKVVSALGGRLSAYRDAPGSEAMRAALVRNLYRDAPPAGPALDHVLHRAAQVSAALAATPAARLIKGEWPASLVAGSA